MKRAFSLIPLVVTLAACHDGDSATGPTQGAPEPVGLRLLNSSPPSGSMVAVEACEGGCTEAVSLRFSAKIDAPLPAGASLKVSLLDAAERECAFHYTPSQNLTVGQAATFESHFLNITCPLPFRTAAVQATLIGDQMGRPHYLNATFPLAYAFVVPSPTSTTPTAPRILTLDWDADGPTGSHACPLPDEGVSVWCSAVDDDGDALTLTLRLENLGPGAISGPTETSRSFPPSPYKRLVSSYFRMQSLTNLRADCEVTDSQGRRATQSIDIPCAR